MNQIVWWPMPKNTYSTLNFTNIFVKRKCDVVYRYYEYKPQADCYNSYETSFTEQVHALGCVKSNTDINTTRCEAGAWSFQ